MNAILAPALDIARVPHGGRAGENLGEDPMLAGEIGGAIGGRHSVRKRSRGCQALRGQQLRVVAHGRGKLHAPIPCHRRSGVEAHAARDLSGAVPTGPLSGTASLACSARTTASTAGTPARTRAYWISRAPSGAGPASQCRISCSRFATHGRRLRPDWICPRLAATRSSPVRIC